jgi:branched-chain amino acid aminotransferase
VAGVMREFILYIAGKEQITVHEHQMTLEELFEADEVFLSNAIYGIRWVEHYKSKVFAKNMAEKLSGFIRSELIES